MPKKDLGKLPARTSIPKSRSIHRRLRLRTSSWFLAAFAKSASLDAGMPAPSTIYRWLIVNQAFSEQYTRAFAKPKLMLSLMKSLI